MLAPMRAPRPYTSEPVDPTEVSPSGRFRAVKQAGLVLLAGAWVALGDVAEVRGESSRAAELYRRAAEALQDVRW